MSIYDKFSKNMVNGMKYGWPCVTEVKMVLLNTIEIYCLLSLEKHSLQFQSLKKFKTINNNLRFNRCYLREKHFSMANTNGIRNPKRNFHGTWLSSVDLTFSFQILDVCFISIFQRFFTLHICVQSYTKSKPWKDVNPLYLWLFVGRYVYV